MMERQRQKQMLQGCHWWMLVTVSVWVSQVGSTNARNREQWQGPGFRGTRWAASWKKKKMDSTVPYTWNLTIFCNHAWGPQGSIRKGKAWSFMAMFPSSISLFSSMEWSLFMASMSSPPTLNSLLQSGFPHPLTWILCKPAWVKSNFSPLTTRHISLWVLNFINNLNQPYGLGIFWCLLNIIHYPPNLPWISDLHYQNASLT